MATYWENSCSFGLRYVSWYECLIVSLFFSHLGFWSGNLFLIAPFPDLCLLVPLYVFSNCVVDTNECNTGTPCLNGGVCSDTPGSFTCNCSGTGYEGDTCQNGKYSLTTCTCSKI